MMPNSLPLNSTSNITRCNPSEKLDPSFQIALYTMIIVASLVGNSLIIAVVTMTKRMQTFSNILIRNMSIADLVITLLPMLWEVVKIAKYSDDSWPLGEFMCVFLNLVVCVSVAATAMSLMAASIDRFYLIVKPQDYTLKPGHYRYVIMAIWFVAFLFGMPNIFAQKVLKNKIPGKDVCIELWNSPFSQQNSPKIYTVVLFTFLYLLPLTLMAMLYSKLCCNLWMRMNPDFNTTEKRRKSIARKRKVVIMLIIIVLIFAIGWLPIFILQFLVYFNPRYIECPLDVPESFVFTGFFLEYLSCALSPVVYFTFSSSYREGLSSLFSSSRRRKLRDRSTTVSRMQLTRHSPSFSRTDTMKTESTERLATPRNSNASLQLSTSNVGRNSFLTVDF